jgi:NAD(P)-dependent dehydrogenase (short-subunit alcohol dehydrogenase family)
VISDVEKGASIMTTLAIADLFNFAGKSAIVTGGAMGMGQGIAFRLAEAGASVMVVDINTEAADQTAEEIETRGGQVAAICADVASLADTRRVIQATLDAFSRIDILVNNAGGMHPFTQALKISEETWSQVLDRNLKSCFFYSQAIAREMVKAGHGGKIINIASVAALHPDPAEAAYNASKAGVVMITKSLALELAPHNILVNAVAPGPTKTPNTEAIFEADKVKKYIDKRVPLGRVGEPDDVARVVVFLASPASDYMTGNLLVVDGGYLLS